MSTGCPPLPSKSFYSEMLIVQFSRSENKYPDVIAFQLGKILHEGRLFFTEMFCQENI